MISLSEISKQINEQDKLRQNQIRNHPKYEPGFEVENRDDTKLWMENKEMLSLLVQKRDNNRMRR